MRIDVLTIFPQMVEGFFNQGVVGQAVQHGKIKMKTWNLREVTKDVHQAIDDRPFGGGDGMVMLPEILKKNLDLVLSDAPAVDKSRRRVIYLSPQGPVLTAEKSQRLARDFDQIILLCGRYGGVDERFIENYVDEEISIGDYILSGGELAAGVLIDAVARHVPEVLGNAASALEETFKDHLLEHPLYTKPREFEGKSVPEVLLSGNHAKIEEWRGIERIRRTLKKRPDLLSQAPVSRAQLSEAFENLDFTKKVAVGLVHYPVYNKTGGVVATNVTNLDIHDIARACRTYGIDNFFIITPQEEQLAFVGRVLKHWQQGRGVDYNPTRGDALSNVRLATSVESALEEWGVPDTQVVATSARPVVGPKPLSFAGLRELGLEKPVFLLFGTGYGLENTLVRRAQYLLEPIRGRAPDHFRHLSVRSAVSIILDRLWGACY